MAQLLLILLLISQMVQKVVFHVYKLVQEMVLTSKYLSGTTSEDDLIILLPLGYKYTDLLLWNLKSASQMALTEKLEEEPEIIVKRF